MAETWRLIEGFYWPYRINIKAEIERQLDSGRWRPVKSYNDRRTRRLMVHMKRANGVFTSIPVKQLMRDVFMGGERPEKVVSFRNEMYTDCSLENLYFTTRTAVAKRTAGGGRRSVEKVDRDGNVVDLYASVSEAARKNYTSRKAIWFRCTHRAKDPFSLDGFNYRYEDRRHRR